MPPFFLLTVSAVGKVRPSLTPHIATDMQDQSIPLDQLRALVAKLMHERQTRHAFTIPQFCAAFNTSRTVAYEEIGSGRLESYQVGRRRFISARAAEAWQRRLEAEANPGSFGFIDLNKA